MIIHEALAVGARGAAPLPATKREAAPAGGAAAAVVTKREPVHVGAKHAAAAAPAAEPPAAKRHRTSAPPAAAAAVDTEELDAEALDLSRAGTAAARAVERAREALPAGAPAPPPQHMHEFFLRPAEAGAFATAAQTMLAWKSSIIPFERASLCAAPPAPRVL